MNAQERLDHLLEEVLIPSNRGRLTHAWVAENVSLAVADGVYTAINAVSAPTALRFVAGTGIDTTAGLWKQQAAAVAQAIPQLSPFLELLRDFELLKQRQWQVEGYAQAPTLEQIQAELNAARLINAKALFSERMTVNGDAAGVWSQAWEDARE